MELDQVKTIINPEMLKNDVRNMKTLAILKGETAESAE